MAEESESSERNNNYTIESCEREIGMLGAVMPSLVASASYGSIKKELECVASQIHHSPMSDNSEHFDHHNNLKSEERDDEERSNASTPRSQGSQDLRESSVLHGRYHNDLDKLHLTKSSSSIPSMASLNGTMQDIINLQKLQNMSMFQHTNQLNAAVISGLGNSPASLLNTPLNLSVSGPSTLPPASVAIDSPTNPQLPQLVLASGQLIQGIQGAQLIIPTAQGVTTQTILTIPVSQQIASSISKEQIFQNISQLMSRPESLQNPLQQIPLAQSPILNSSNILNSHPFLSNNAQQILQTIQPPNILPGFATGAVTQHQQRDSQSCLASKLSSNEKNHINERKMHSSGNHPRLSPLGNRERSSRNAENRPKSHSPQLSNLSSISSSFLVERSREHTNSGSLGGTARITPTERLASEREHHKSSPVHKDSNRDSQSPTFSSRLTPTNGELPVSKSGPSHFPSASASQPVSPKSQTGNYSGAIHMSAAKKSPSQNAKVPLISPADSDNSGGDLLNDSPNELTINQTTCNVVDGIDLDEIKEFAKAFKLRRLSLGLTQTQVGQALSVTEGPAYSQSAICSALAAQMYAAAQISSQQQQMFEKLDITPKSAQKIKPVLEKWMKEAEERYKTGQNHLTDFIGVEPSKKRKRRTSFTPQALELLNAHFERNTHPSGTEITGLAHQLGYEREVIRIWFCNKRQALKNTVRMMSKGMV